LTAEDFKAYFSSLVDRRSWSVVTIERSGIDFFYRHVLDQPWPGAGILKRPAVHSLPDILALDEIARLIIATRERRFQTFWWTVYSLGLRLGEGLNLRVGDIDSARGQVHVRAGKGRKDRFVVLPALTLACLRRYWREHRHPELLFPGRGAHADAGMCRGTTQHAFSRVVADCGIRKKLSIHSLRHAYATHLIELGLNLSGVQALLGHAHSQTTLRYIHMTDTGRDDRRILIDGLVSKLRDALIRLRG
jgi:site-specific recombinase XerD